MLQVWYAGFIVTVLSLAKLSGTVFYERGHHGHHGPSLHALTERLADNFATTSATDRSQKCHLDRTASFECHFLNLSGIEVISQLCVRVQTSDCRQLEMGLQSCIALFPVEEAFWLEETSHTLSASSRHSQQEFPLNPFYFTLQLFSSNLSSPTLKSLKVFANQ